MRAFPVTFLNALSKALGSVDAPTDASHSGDHRPFFAVAPVPGKMSLPRPMPRFSSPGVVIIGEGDFPGLGNPNVGLSESL